jgi:hypothetical protein
LIHLIKCIKTLHASVVSNLKTSFQAALEAIQRWSELHQKQQQENTTTTATRDDQAYLPIVIKACYDVFDYPQGWLVDSTVFIFNKLVFL